MINRIRKILNMDGNMIKGIYPPYEEKYKALEKGTANKNLVTQAASKLDAATSETIKSQHRFYTDINGYHYEMFLYKKNSPKLYIALNGARTRHEKKGDIPYFNRWSYYTFLDGSVLVIEDPMYYKFSELTLGWYYGTEEENGCREGLYKVIHDVAGLLGVKNEDMCFYASSGGGTVAIHMASLFEGSVAIALNPQIALSKWSYAQNFSDITGVDLDACDPWNRNEPAMHIKTAKRSTFVICVNEESEKDREQLTSFCEKYKCEPVKGINKYGNLVIWKYAAKTQFSHNAFETQEMLWPILFLGQIAKKRSNISKYQELYLLIGDLWRDLWKWRASHVEASEKSMAHVVFTKETEKTEVLHDYEEGISFQPTDNNYQYVKILEKLESAKTYKIEIRSEKNFIPYDLAVYNFAQRQFIKRYEVKEPVATIYLAFEQTNTETYSLLMYNGKFGKTSGNQLVIDSIQISTVTTGENK